MFNSKDFIIFNGTLDYEHKVKVASTTEYESDLIVKSIGEISDLSDGESKESKQQMNLDVVQKVTEKELIENCYGLKNQAISLIPNKIALQLPLSEKANWSQNVSIENKEYKAISTIDKIEKDKAGLRKIYVSTTIKDIDGYKDKTYKENSVYEENKGLISFNKTLPEKDGIPEFSIHRFEK